MMSANFRLRVIIDGHYQSILKHELLQRLAPVLGCLAGIKINQRWHNITFTPEQLQDFTHINALFARCDGSRWRRPLTDSIICAADTLRRRLTLSWRLRKGPSPNPAPQHHRRETALV